MILWLSAPTLEEDHKKRVTEIIGYDVYSQWENLAYDELTTDDLVARREDIRRIWRGANWERRVKSSLKGLRESWKDCNRLELVPDQSFFMNSMTWDIALEGFDSNSISARI